MAKSKRYTVKYRRKREGKTDYLLRRKLIDSSKDRIVIRRMLNNIVVQFIEYTPKGDKVVAVASSQELKKDYGWKGHGGNLSAAYLSGYLCGFKSKVKEGVIDIGLASAVKGSAFFAVAKGLIDAGVNVPCSENVIPAMERIEGKTVEQFAQKLKSDLYKKQFSGLIAKGLKPETLSKHFEDVKKKIEAKWKK